jgi:BASS family bile acid:Na+ symporter
MDVLAKVFLPLSLVFIMLSMGLSLTIKDFTNIKKYPKAFFVGCFLQIISLPIIAYLVASFGINYLNISAELAVGLIIISACPGGVTSNLMVYMGKGNTALSISLTSVISILSVFTIPFIVNFGFTSFMGTKNESPLPITRTIIGIFAVTVIPVLIGMFIKVKSENFTNKFEPIASKISSLLFVLIVVGIIIQKWDLLIENITSLGPLSLAFNLLVMFVAILVSRLFSLDLKEKIAIVFECGLQNGTLAIMITLTFLGNETMMLPAGMYGILMFITGGLYLLYIKLNNKHLMQTNPGLA